MQNDRARGQITSILGQLNLSESSQFVTGLGLPDRWARRAHGRFQAGWGFSSWWGNGHRRGARGARSFHGARYGGLGTAGNSWELGADGVLRVKARVQVLGGECSLWLSLNSSIGCKGQTKASIGSKRSLITFQRVVLRRSSIECMGCGECLYQPKDHLEVVTNPTS